MADDSAHPHHGIDYVELSVLDLEAAKRFYGSAVGWAFNDYGPGYAGIQKAGGGEAGGLAVADEVRGGGPLVVLYSDAIEETFSAVQTASGRVTKEIFASPVGRRFHFADPSGNELAVWTLGESG